MKRVIKFWNKFNDKGFNDCGTEYEVLPILVEDDAGPKELLCIAKQFGIKNKKVETLLSQSRFGKTEITHKIKTGEQTSPKFQNKEKFDWYLGFVTLNENGPLKPIERVGKKKISEEQIEEIINNQYYGLWDIGEFSQVYGKSDLKIIMENWNYYHEIKLLGYNMEHFEKTITNKKTYKEVKRVFEDSIDSCSDCGTYDYRDDGHSYNFKIINGETLGINCGCFDEHCRDNLLDFVNETENVIELSIAEALEKEGTLKHVERFIGGITDGRGGYFRGQITREGTPEDVLKEFQTKEPKSKFLITHDKSGQFQSYFSIWKLTKKALTKKAG